MIECIIRYYFKSPIGRVVRFERTAKFPAIPHAGSLLELKDDCLVVEQVNFCENATSVLVVKDYEVSTNSEFIDIIEDMKGRGWCMVSDNKK